MLSEHFSESELRVAGAEQRVIDNATHLCTTLLEPIRAYCGGPLIITSGYRDPKSNAATGGVQYSEHEYTDDHAAADFHPSTKDMIDVFGWICASGLHFRQCILERDHNTHEPVCIHISCRLRGNDKHEALIGESHGTGTYTKVPCTPESSEEPEE